MDGHRGTAGYPHPPTGLAKTDDHQGVLRNTSLYRKYQFSAFSSISLPVKIKLDREVGKEGNFISCKKCMLIYSYSSEEGQGCHCLLEILKKPDVRSGCRALDTALEPEGESWSSAE